MTPEQALAGNSYKAFVRAMLSEFPDDRELQELYEAARDFDEEQDILAMREMKAMRDAELKARKTQ